MVTEIVAAAVLVLSMQPSAAPAVWVESPGTMILPNRPAGPARQIALVGVRNGTCSAQIALRAEQDAGQVLAFDWTALSAPSGKAIARENIRLFRAADISVDHGQKVDPAKDNARARAYGSFPDALVPLIGYEGENVANTITPAGGRTAAFWVDVLIPPGTPPGTYSGRIVLKPAGAAADAPETRAVPVTVQVRDVEVPADSSFPSLFNLRLHAHVKANLDRYVAEALRHRVAPTNYHYVEYCLRDGFELTDRFNPDGRGFVNVYYWVNKKPEGAKVDELIGGLRKITAHLEERKLLDRAYLYLTDEPGKKDIPGVVEAARLIVRHVPQWKNRLLCTVYSEGTDLDSLLTFQGRALKLYGRWYVQAPPFPAGREEWDRRRAEGKQLWFYASNAQGTPFPTFDVQTLNLAFEPRVFAWAYWYEKAAGHLYWDLMFQASWELHRRFPPGDGQLIYPGDFTLKGVPAWAQVKDLHGPVVSRRLKLHRQGLEELELLKLAEAKAGRAKVQSIVEKVYTCLGQRTWSPGAYDPAKPMWSYEEAAWDRARAELIGLLEAK